MDDHTTLMVLIWLKGVLHVLLFTDPKCSCHLHFKCYTLGISFFLYMCALHRTTTVACSQGLAYRVELFFKWTCSNIASNASLSIHLYILVARAASSAKLASKVPSVKIFTLQGEGSASQMNGSVKCTGGYRAWASFAPMGR